MQVWRIRSAVLFALVQAIAAVCVETGASFRALELVRNPIAQRGGTPELTQTRRDSCGAQWVNGQQALGNVRFEIHLAAAHSKSRKRRFSSWRQLTHVVCVDAFNKTGVSCARTAWAGQGLFSQNEFLDFVADNNQGSLIHIK
jgi:hypothetical protein